MRFSIQLLTEVQRSAHISVRQVDSSTDIPTFDVVLVEIEKDRAYYCSTEFLVPAGRGEALAEALRKACAP